MEKEDKEETVKIVDRRRFNSEGEVRSSEDIPKEEVRRAAPSMAAPSMAASSINAPKDKPRPASKPSESAQGEEVEFSSLVMSLATQALMMLGEVPHPESKAVQVNMEAAKQTIDILAMLETKTKGNLSKDEERLMTEIISSLRMVFVQKVSK